VKAVRHYCPSNFKRKEKKEQGLEGKEKQGEKLWKENFEGRWTTMKVWTRFGVGLAHRSFMWSETIWWFVFLVFRFYKTRKWLHNRLSL
jgi:hypothetical protein